MEELRKRRHTEQIWFRAICQAEELPCQRLPQVEDVSVALPADRALCRFYQSWNLRHRVWGGLCTTHLAVLKAPPNS